MEWLRPSGQRKLAAKTRSPRSPALGKINHSHTFPGRKVCSDGFRPQNRMHLLTLPSSSRAPTAGFEEAMWQSHPSILKIPLWDSPKKMPQAHIHPAKALAGKGSMSQCMNPKHISVVGAIHQSRLYALLVTGRFMHAITHMQGVQELFNG